ncbi:hypothetical protein RB595_009015 [Gaeumannomyces hyphopodioides]
MPSRGIFRELHLSHRPEHCEHVLALARRYGHHTRKLFYSTRVGVDEDEYGAKQFTRPVLARAAAALLSGASDPDGDTADSGRPLLPNLGSLSIDIRGTYELGMKSVRPSGSRGFRSNGKLCKERWGPHPGAEHVRRFEGRHAWRALLTEVWAAASANRTVRDLTVDKYHPARTSAADTDEYGAFIGRLESLSIVSSAATGRGVQKGGRPARVHPPNRAPGFHAYVCASLGDTFFRHARSLRRLRIESEEWACLGTYPDFPH